MLIYVLLVLMAIYIVNNRFLGKDYSIVNPISVSVYVWILVILIHSYLFRNERYTYYVYSIIIFGNLALSLGFWITCKKKFSFDFSPLNGNRSYVYSEIGLRKLLYLFTILEGIRVLYKIYLIIYKLAGSWNAFLKEGTYVRNMYLSYNGNILENLFEFFCSANALVGYVVLGILFAKSCKKFWKYFFLWSILEIIYALITMSKMCLIMFIIVVGTAFLNNLGTEIQQKKIIRKYFPVLVVVLFLFLLLIGMQRNYANSGSSLVSIVIQKAGIYFAGPTEALGKYIYLYDTDRSLGTKTFVILSRILSRLAISSNNVVLAHGDDIFIGYESINAYTWFKVFYQDYGFWGIIIVPCVIGMIAGAFYNSKEHSLFTDVGCAWGIAAIGLSFYTFIWGQTIYVFILFYAFFMHIVFMNRIYEKN